MINTISKGESAEVLTDAEQAELKEYSARLRKMPTEDVVTEWAYYDAELPILGNQSMADDLTDETSAFLAYRVTEYQRKHDTCAEELHRRDRVATLPAGGAVGIDPAILQEIKSRIDLRELVEEYGVALKQRGHDFVGRCPFHDDRDPSLHVYPDGHFHCFGCQVHGDAYDFVMRRDSMNFGAALRELATYANVELPKRNGKGNPAPSKGDQAEEQKDATEAQDGQYLIRDGRICRWKPTRDGAALVHLCNFSARITEEVAHDNGIEVTRLLTIEGKQPGGANLPPARVDASQFAGMHWVTPNWGTRAIVEAGQSAQDHLRAAIQHLSPNVATRHVYTHTGWREIKGKMVFLSQTGAIGGELVAVELEKELERYQLPLQPTGVREALQSSLRFLDIAPRRVTVPLWAAMYLAPIAPIIFPKFTVWVYGVTGVLKSTLCALALCHFGDFTENDLIEWTATSNALEKYLFLAKDVPFLLDDFAPKSDPNAARKLEDTAGRLVRGVGNRSGRARMNGDLSLRTVYRPRGLVISTGEQLPDGQSLVARIVTIEMKKGDVELDKLNGAQDEREDYPHAMSGYIQWLANQWDHLQETLPNAWRDLRAKARKEGQHLRLPESIASLYVGMDMGLTFAVEVGAIPEHDAAELRREGWLALAGIAENQHKQIEEQRPTRRFLTVLTELLTQGKVHLNSIASPDASDSGDLMGWYDTDYIYLLPSASYNRVAQFERDEGRYFGIKDSALRKALHEEGILIVEEGRSTTRVLIGGKQQRVLKLVLSEIEKISGGSFQKAVKSV